mgnify:CR=1 FL=1
MESTHTLAGSNGAPLVVTTGHGHHDYGHRNDDCLETLILSNAIHTSTGSVINAVSDGTRDAAEAANRNGIAGIKETSDTGRDIIRETSRVGSDLASQIADSRSAVERTSGEGRLATAIAAGEIRELITANSSINLLAIKDNGFAVREEGCKTRERVLEEGCKTREKSAEQYAALQLEAAKNFAAVQLKACEDRAALAAQIAECCCEQKQEAAATRALILAEGQKRCEAENANLRLELLLSKQSSGPGNSGKI